MIRRERGQVEAVKLQLREAEEHSNQHLNTENQDTLAEAVLKHKRWYVLGHVGSDSQGVDVVVNGHRLVSLIEYLDDDGVVASLLLLRVDGCIRLATSRFFELADVLKHASSLVLHRASTATATMVVMLVALMGGGVRVTAIIIALGRSVVNLVAVVTG